MYICALNIKLLIEYELIQKEPIDVNLLNSFRIEMSSITNQTFRKNSDSDLSVPMAKDFHHKESLNKYTDSLYFYIYSSAV